MAQNIRSCRVCRCEYNSKNTTRSNIFINNKDKTAETWDEILKKLGVFISQKQGFSDTICKPCQSSAIRAQKSFQIVSKWQAENPKKNSPKKRMSNETQNDIQDKRCRTEELPVAMTDDENQDFFTGEQLVAYWVRLDILHFLYAPVNFSSKLYLQKIYNSNNP